MGWIADLLQEIPSAARYKAELESMEKENAKLKEQVALLTAANQRLEAQAAQNSAAGPQLDKECELALLYVSKHARASAKNVAHAVAIPQARTDMHLVDLQEKLYVTKNYAWDDGDYFYSLMQDGRRYLNKKGLL
jgi:hypothetical protein